MEESDINWTVKSHSISLEFPRQVVEKNNYIVRCKPIDVSHGKTPEPVEVRENKITIDNLHDDTDYDISVFREDDDGKEHLCFKVRKSTEKPAILSLLRNATKDRNDPGLFHLEPTSSTEDDTPIEYRRFIFNEPTRNQIVRTVILLGGKDTGKTTLVNTIANHFLGVHFADNIRICITKENNPKKPTSSNIVCYELEPPENSRYPWTLNIAYTQSFKPKDNEHTIKSLQAFIETLQHRVNMLCLVMRSTSRDDTYERSILQEIQSGFAKRPDSVFTPVFTFYSGGSPSALNVLTKADFPCNYDDCLYFNNSTFDETKKDRIDISNERSESLNKLFSCLDKHTDNIETKDTTKTDEVVLMNNENDIKIYPSSSELLIKWAGAHKKNKIQYRRKMEMDQLVDIYTDEPEARIGGLKGDTLYEIRIFEEDQETGSERKICETAVKTLYSKGAVFLTFTSRDKENHLIHHFNTEKKQVPGADVIIPKIDCLPSRAEERTVLIFGERGCGKKKLVDAMINYIFLVAHADEFRYCITEKDFKNSKWTGRVTVFRITPPTDSKFKYVLNVAVVPGFEYRKEQKNTNILSNLQKMLDSGTIKNISLACLVIRSTCRLTEDQRHLFTFVTSALGKDVSFLVPLVTFHDGGSSNALAVLRQAAVPFFDHLHFIFNNANLNSLKESLILWKERKEVLQNLLQETMTTQNISVEVTRKVLDSLGKIYEIEQQEKTVCNRFNYIKTQIHLRRERNTNNEITPKTQMQEKRKERSIHKNINCERCKTTCKSSCRRPWGWFWYFLIVIETICCQFCGIWNILNCECKCRLEKHVVENFIYVFSDKLFCQNKQEYKLDNDEIEAKELLTEYRILYNKLKFENEHLRNNALYYTDQMLVTKMKRFLEKEN